MKRLTLIALAIVLLAGCGPLGGLQIVAPPQIGAPPARPTTTPTLARRELLIPIARPTATPPPIPPAATAAPEAAPDPGLGALQAELADLIAGWDGEQAVSVTDLQTGQTISVNGSRPQLAACMVKIAMMIAVAQDIEAGRYTAEDVGSLVQAAMGPSYTPPARELIARVGGGDIGAGIRRINAIMEGAGATGSLLTHPPGYSWEEYGYMESHGTDENRITAEDMTRLLGKLYRGELLSPWATDYVLTSMTIAPDWMDGSLGDPLPEDARLYHKIGQLYAPEYTWNDAGIVVFERGGQEYAYTIAYLGSYGASWQDNYTHGASVSGAAWRYFNARYGEG